ncbi:MAG: Rieske (2Fe-2S) protein, partial [Bacteroidota bacterium]
LAAAGGAVKKRFASLNDGEVIIIVRIDEGTFSAFAAQCTHWGAEVNTPKNGVLVCPFHGSRFAEENGEVIEGPAGSPLKKFAVNWDRQQEKLFLSKI